MEDEQREVAYASTYVAAAAEHMVVGDQPAAARSPPPVESEQVIAQEVVEENGNYTVLTPVIFSNGTVVHAAEVIQPTNGYITAPGEFFYAATFGRSPNGSVNEETSDSNYD